MMVRTLVLTAGLAAGGLLLFVAKSQTSPNAVPVQAIITVEARHTHGYEVPKLQPGDVWRHIPTTPFGIIPQPPNLATNQADRGYVS